jgi:hypothetical protein
MHPTYVHFMATASKHNYNQDNTTGNTKRYRGPNSRASVFSFTFVLRLFTGQFCIKAAQTDSKRLESREGVAIVHREHIPCYFSKL